ncbi:MAG: PKD domain-containing protein [Acidobacteria bacterium]|nr:PKD domain-containing protein [Acidobacteriota bacterium]
MSRTLSTLVALATTVALGGCTVKKTEAPSLAGPSEFGLSVRTTAVPDILGQDGLSQSQVEIVARGADGRPARAVAMRVEMMALRALADYGRLSARTVVTGDDGIARLVYTAPPPLPEPVDPYTIVTLLVTPITGDYAGSNTRSVEIRLVPPSTVPVIIPPNGAPQPSFIVTPTPVTTYTPVTFDASATRDEGVLCGVNCTYAWDFGDGSSGTGMIVSHEYRTAGTFIARLTVTDLRGQSATTPLPVVVTTTAAPKAEFTFSPAVPRFGQEVFFNAAASTAAPGHRIVAYDWDFGTGRKGTGLTVAKRYDIDLIPPGSVTGEDVAFNVTLTVTDDTFAPAGVGVVTKAVTIKVP